MTMHCWVCFLRTHILIIVDNGQSSLSCGYESPQRLPYAPFPVVGCDLVIGLSCRVGSSPSAYRIVSGVRVCFFSLLLKHVLCEGSTIIFPSALEECWVLTKQPVRCVERTRAGRRGTAAAVTETRSGARTRPPVPAAVVYFGEGQQRDCCSDEATRGLTPQR